MFTYVHDCQDFARRRRLDDTLRESSIWTVGVGDTVRSKAPGGNGPVEPLYNNEYVGEAVRTTNAINCPVCLQLCGNDEVALRLIGHDFRNLSVSSGRGVTWRWYVQ